MKGSTRDKLKGTIKEVKSAEKAGRMENNPQSEDRGAAEKVGNIQKGFRK